MLMDMDMDAAVGFGPGIAAPEDAAMAVVSRGSGLGDGRHSA